MTDSPDPRPRNALVPADPQPAPESPPDFTPVPVRPRLDGWTAARQRAFIEYLANHGDVRAAAAHVGMSWQSAYDLRRRPDAEAFDKAWVAALERTHDKLVETAFDRAVKGAVRGRYWRGELISEERVPSDRMLIWLIGKGRAVITRAKRRERGVSGFDEVLDQLTDVHAGPEPCFRVWHDDTHERPLTNAPPPARFKGMEIGVFGAKRYCRDLTDEEWGAYEARNYTAVSKADQEAARRTFFGLERAANRESKAA